MPLTSIVSPSWSKQFRIEVYPPIVAAYRNRPDIQQRHAALDQSANEMRRIRRDGVDVR
jgi:hypothetical protein